MSILTSLRRLKVDRLRDRLGGVRLKEFLSDARGCGSMAARQDKYALVLAAWRADLDAWEEKLAAWDGACALSHPPRPPTTARYTVQDAAVMAERKEAYINARAVCDEAHARWAARNRVREKEYHAEYDAERDWAAESAAKMKLVRPDEARAMHPLVLARLEESCVAPDLPCSCALCEGARAARAEHQQAILLTMEQESCERVAFMSARAAEAQELEEQVAAMTPAQLASKPPTAEQVAAAERYARLGANGPEYCNPRDITPAALVAARINVEKARAASEIKAAVERLVDHLEEEEEMREIMADPKRKYKYQITLVLEQAKWQVPLLAPSLGMSKMQAEVQAVRFDAVRNELQAKLQGLGSLDGILAARLQALEDEAREAAAELARIAAEGRCLKSAPAWCTATGGVCTFAKACKDGHCWDCWGTQEDAPPVHAGKLCDRCFGWAISVATESSGMCRACLEAGTPCDDCIFRAMAPSWASSPDYWVPSGDDYRAEKMQLLYLEWCVPVSANGQEAWPRARAELLQWNDWPREWVTIHDLAATFERARRLAASRPVNVPADQASGWAELLRETRELLCPHLEATARSLCWHWHSQEQCGSCLRQRTREAVRFRFEGDSDERRAWLAERARECNTLTELEKRQQQLMEAFHAHMTQRRAEEQRRREEREQVVLQKECARVEAAAAQAGRPRITPENAAAWSPPEMHARGDDGVSLHLIEERRYYPRRSSGGHWLTREQLMRLPASERHLCLSERCPHEGKLLPHEGMRWLNQRDRVCMSHCQCAGYSRTLIHRPMPHVDHEKDVVTSVENHSDCRFIERRVVTSVIDLSAPVLWYWQMTGSIFYDFHLLSRLGTGSLDVVVAQALQRCVGHSGEQTLYERQVDAWREMRGQASSSTAKRRRAAQDSGRRSKPKRVTGASQRKSLL